MDEDDGDTDGAMCIGIMGELNAMEPGERCRMLDAEVLVGVAVTLAACMPWPHSSTKSPCSTCCTHSTKASGVSDTNVSS